MHPQLLPIRRELESSSDWVSRLAQWAGEEYWAMRPSAGSWSASECVQHLNATTKAMIPLMRSELRGVERATRPPKYRFNFMGWLVWRSSSPPVKMKFRTQSPFVPPDARSTKDDLVAWAVCQSDVLDALEEADGRQLNQLKIVSPFDGRVRYNLYAAFRIIAAHQRRHLGQAEKAIEAARSRQA